MAKNIVRLQPASRVKFVRNEPAKPVRGGASRKSTVVSRSEFPLVRRREQLNALLLSHCSDVELQNFLKAEDEQLLHRICLEPVSTGNHPMIRKKAIRSLRFFQTASTFNTLTDLAERGEDEYLRGQAINTLGVMGAGAGLPSIVKGLGDTSKLVQLAATNAVGLLVNKLGEEAVLSGIRFEKRPAIVRGVKNIIKGSQKKQVRPKGRRPLEAKAEK